MNKNHISLKKLRQGLILFFLLGSLGLSSCTWDEIPPPKIEIPDEPISFSDDIIPIFEANCNASNCHGGFWKPDLRPNNAYNELTTGGYIDIDSPADSELYVKISPGQSMADYATPQDRALILQWITEGAENK